MHIRYAEEVAKDPLNVLISFYLFFYCISRMDRDIALVDELSASRNLEPTGPPDRTYKVGYL